MRISLVAFFCAVGFAVSGGSGTLADDKADLEKEVRKFQGTWTFASSETGGKQLPAGELKRLILTFDGDKHTVKMGDEVVQVGTQKLDPSKSPKAIDVTMAEGLNKGTVMLGIYEIDGDTLKVCFDPQGKKRPTEFKSALGSENFVNVHRRVKKLAAVQSPQGDKAGANKDLELLQGTWSIDTMEWGGKSLPKELMNGYKFVFAGNKLTWEGAIGMQSKGGKVMAIDGTFPCDFKIDPGKEPKQIDITLHLKKGDWTVLGIYEIKGDTLKVCHFGSKTGQRPAEFSTKGGLNIGYHVLTRTKK